MTGSTREDDLHDLIVEASERTALWTDVLTEMLSLSNSLAGGLYIQQAPPPGASDPAMIQAIPFQGYGAGMLERYNAHYHALNPAHVHAEHLGLGRVITERDLAVLSPGADLDNTEFFTDWCRPQNFHHAMGETLANNGVPLTLWVNRGREAGAFGEAEQQRFHRLARSVLRAVRTGERLAHARHELDGLRQALATQGFAALTLDSRSVLRSLNAVAEDALRREDGLRLRQGRLEALDPRDAAALERAIQMAASPILGPASPERTLAIRRAGGREPLRLSVAATRGRTGLAAPLDAASVVLMFAYEPPGHQADRTAFGAHFGLTPAELRLVGELIDGATLKDAAGRFGIGYETARSHLKAVFGKTGTRRQVELVTLLLSWKKF